MGLFRRMFASGWALALGLSAGACVESARSADAPLEERMALARAARQLGHIDGPRVKMNLRPNGIVLRRASQEDETGHVDAGVEPTLEEDPADDPGAGPANDGLLGTVPDARLRESLAHAGVKRIERGRGGRSLGFKITLADGSKAYFKPEQSFSAANWFGEVAAYHLDRMLGLGRVPLVVSREFPWSQLAPIAGSDPRRKEVTVRDGRVRGAFVAWVKGGLRPLVEREGWERWLRVKHWPSSSVSPFQRPAVWQDQLMQVRRFGDNWRSKEERQRRRDLHPVPDRPDRVSELSDLIVFDYLTRNMDRWGGDNANVLVRGPAGPLVFLDNGAGFEPGIPRPSLMEARLHVLQRFRRSTVQAIRALDLNRFEDRLSREVIQPVLRRAQLDGLVDRRRALLEWVSQMERTYGEAIWILE